MSENNKLIFMDVDATLYSKEQRLVPESTIKAIHEAQENGHKVLINTGRPLVYFEKEILDIGCDGYLCSNGVHILLDGETIYHKTVPETVVEQIKRICEENNIYGTFEGEKCSYFRDHNVDFHPHYGFMITAFDLAPYMAHELHGIMLKILIKGLVLHMSLIISISLQMTATHLEIVITISPCLKLLAMELLWEMPVMS